MSEDGGRRASGVVVTIIVVALVALLAVGTVATYALVTAGRTSGALSAAQDQLARQADELKRISAALSELGTSQQESSKSAKENAAFNAPADLDEFIEKIRSSTVTITCGNTLGSGWAIDLTLDPEMVKEGYTTAIITNHHVIEGCTYEGARDVQLEHDGGLAPAYVWSWDETNDLAMITAVESIEPLPTGQKPSVGAWVMAVGSPFGYTGTATSGRITNIGGSVLLTDAAINHGNSGGPLADSMGRVVGINTFKREDADNTGFALGLPLLCERVLQCVHRFWK